MRLASYVAEGRNAYGAVTADGIVDLSRRIGARYPTLLDIIRDAALADAREAVGQAAPDHALCDVALLPPVIAPEAFWTVGTSDIARMTEYNDGAPPPDHPSMISRSAQSVVGHGTPIERPRASQQLDYEGEIVLVIGRTTRHASREDALASVFGMTLCNEGTVRDWVSNGAFIGAQGKNFDRSGSIGPWIVTADELDPASRLHLATRVNGQLRQYDTTDRLMFPFADIIAYVSSFATLRPGDMIATGTPTGAGARFTPPRWLRPGDVVEIEVPGIGQLRNSVIDER